MPTDRDAPLVSCTPLAGAFFRLRFCHPEVAGQARAGQFVMMKAGHSTQPPLRRPFSVLNVEPEDDTFSLFIKAVGPGSRGLTQLTIGARAQCLGPLGRPFAAPPAGHRPLLVAGGYGIAPFLLFSRELHAAGQEPIVFYGGRTAGDLVLQQPFAASDVELILATEDGSAGHHGLVTAAVAERLQRSAEPCALYACGPTPMLQAVAELALKNSLSAQVSLDPWMGCGIGTCLGCVVSIQEPHEPRATLRCACTRGPVFDAATVVWPGRNGSGTRGQTTGAGS